MVSVEWSWLTMTNANRVYDNDGGTPDVVIVVAACAVVMVSVIWVGICCALRVANIVYVFDVLDDLIGPVVRRRQIIKWTAGGD